MKLPPAERTPHPAAELFPVLDEDALHYPGYVTGMAWTKSNADDDGEPLAEGIDGDQGHYGPGYHAAAASEPVLIYCRGQAYIDRSAKLRGAWFERPNEHSEKPIHWMAQWIRDAGRPSACAQLSARGGAR